jgi:hypothetical protein
MTLLRTTFLQLKTIISQSLRWLWRYGLAIISFCLFYIAFIPSSTIFPYDVWQTITVETTPYHFNFITWELNAIGAKAEQILFSQVALMSEDKRGQFVRDYMADLRQALQFEAEIETIFSDPTISNPETMTNELRSERDVLRTDLNQRRPIAEAILEGQVAAILVDKGFGTFGQLLPPMAMRFTGMPNLLVLSARDEIRIENNIVINPMPIDQQASLETQIDSDYDVSSLVVPLGGIALYPAMVRESSWLPSVIETFAHEWLHHYLAFHPLGISYLGEDENARKINETTADLFGKEIAALVLDRYYPELPAPALPTFEPVEVLEPDPNAFDFNAAMYETRVTVDSLLADGQIDEAEAYMEERRLFLYENGYRIRRLNQAYFAFYGRYQAGGGGAGIAGNDPIGPAIIVIRQNSNSLYDFVVLMQDISSLETLQHLLDS